MSSEGFGIHRIQMLSMTPDRRFWSNNNYRFQVMLAWLPPEHMFRLAQSQYGKDGSGIERYNDSPIQKTLHDEMVWSAPQEPCALFLEDAVITSPVIKDGQRYSKIVDASPHVHVVGHDGRHRAQQAAALNISLMPTRVFIKDLPSNRPSDKIWERPDIESRILRYLRVPRFKIDVRVA